MGTHINTYTYKHINVRTLVHTAKDKQKCLRCSLWCSEAPQSVFSLTGEVLSPPIVKFSSIRTHSKGLKAYFHNPLQKPAVRTLLCISPLRTMLHPANFSFFSPLASFLTFSLASHSITSLDIRSLHSPLFISSPLYFRNRELLPCAVESAGKQNKTVRTIPGRERHFPWPQ